RSRAGRLRAACRLPEVSCQGSLVHSRSALQRDRQPDLARGAARARSRPEPRRFEERAMSFTDTSFLILLLVTYALWLACRRNYPLAVGLLLGSSVYFYGYRQSWLLALLLAYCVLNWAVGCWVARKTRSAAWVLGLGVAFNLAVLAFWKYTPLALQTLANL